MSDIALPYVVIDTNVVFEGITTQGSAAGLVIDCWRTGLVRVAISNSIAYEYADVLSRKLSESRWHRIKPVLEYLLARAEFVTIYFSWRPASPDPGDEHIIDCAMNAGATVVTANIRDFKSAEQSLGLRVITPVELINQLAK